MPAPIDPTTRRAIADAIRAGGTCRGIAREFNVSDGTVRNIAAEAGVDQPFTRAQTKSATLANMADSKAVRVHTAARLLTEANKILDKLRTPYLVHSFGGRDNTYNDHLLDQPPAADIRHLMTAAAVAIDKHIVIERHDSDQGVEVARSMLLGVADGLRALYDRGDMGEDDEITG